MRVCKDKCTPPHTHTVRSASFYELDMMKLAFKEPVLFYLVTKVKGSFCLPRSLQKCYWKFLIAGLEGEKGCLIPAAELCSSPCPQGLTPILIHTCALSLLASLIEPTLFEGFSMTAPALNFMWIFSEFNNLTRHMASLLCRGGNKIRESQVQWFVYSLRAGIPQGCIPWGSGLSHYWITVGSEG